MHMMIASDEISLGKIAESVGLHYEELLERLITQRIPLNFGPSNLEEAEKELEVLRKYKKKPIKMYPKT